jgi:PAS domain-containing protein
MTHSYQETSHKIIELLHNKAPRPLSISAISRELGLHRSGVANYLEMLQTTGEVKMSPFGRSKCYTIAERVPYTPLLDIYTDAVVVLDNRGCIEMANKKFFLMFDILQDSDIIGLNIAALHLDIFSLPSIQKNIRKMLDGSLYETEIQYIEKSTKQVFDLRFIQNVSNKGSTSFLVNISDITYQTQQQDELKILEKKLGAIFDEVPVGIMFVDACGTLLKANKASMDMLSIRDSKSSMALNVLDLLDISSLISGEDIAEDLLNKGAIAESEIIYHVNKLQVDSGHREKRVVFLKLTVAPLTAVNGGKLLKEYMILLRDITAERNSITELDKKGTRYRSFFDDACNGMLILQMDNNKDDLRFKDVNKAAEQLLRIKKEDVIGKRCSDVFPRLRPPEYMEGANAALDGAPQTLPPLQYVGRHKGPWISHYLFTLPSGEIASLVIDVRKDCRKDRSE